MKNILLYAMAGLTLTGCLKLKNEDEDRSAQNTQQIDAYVTQNGLTPTKTPQGLYYVIRNPNPSGRMPKVGETVTTNFAMYLSLIHI